MSKAIQERLQEQLTQRNVWEQRQRIWYEMLHDGLPRRNKPFPNAANLHLPIAENVVQKLMPYYVNSVFSRNVLASFTALDTQLGDATSAAESYLDYRLRKQSNFAKAWCRGVFWMLGCGRALIKVRWDAKRKRLDFEAVEPLHFIGDTQYDEPEEMDLFAHVKQVSVAQYKRLGIFKQDALEQIRGGENQADQWKEQEKEFREGINASKNKDVVVLWEAYERVEEGWLVRTFSPSKPEQPVRDEFLLSMRWQQEPINPFVSLVASIEESGWYAPRGSVERVAPFETYGTKMWNQKADWLEYCAKPLFERDPQSVMTNTANVGLKPGDALPPGLKPAAMPAAPMALDEEINIARMLAEETAQVPDFGVTPEGNGQEKRTATEMQYIGSFASQGIQYKAFVSSLFEAEIYKRAWALLVDNAQGDLAYFSGKERKVLPAQALHDNYMIEPDAVADSWDKGKRVQRSVARFQMFAQNPFIQQGELVKSVLEADDPRLVKRLYIDPGTKAANEKEDEAIEIGILLEGYPAAVMPGEDHATRLQMLFAKLQALSMMPPPQTPAELSKMLIGRTRMQEHIAQHLQLLEQENPEVAKQFKAAIGVVDPGTAAGAPAPMAGVGAMTLPGDTEPPGLPGTNGLPGVQAGQPVLEGMA